MRKQATVVLLGLAGASVAAGPAWAQDDRLALGRQVFTRLATPACAVCHTLRDAGSEGAVGPVFDELQPDAQRVANAVRNGIGVMPSYRAVLTDAQIDAVAFYVSTVSRLPAK